MSNSSKEKPKLKKSKLEQFEDILENYYKHFDKEYRNDEGIGKLQEWMNENGFDENDFKDELESNIDDCTFVDFDEDFPIQQMKKTGDNKEKEKNEKIYDILQKIYNGETSILAIIGYLPAKGIHLFSK